MSKSIHNKIVTDITAIFEDAIEEHGARAVYLGFISVNGKPPFEAVFDKIKVEVQKAKQIEDYREQDERLRAKAQQEKEQRKAEKKAAIEERKAGRLQ